MSIDIHHQDHNIMTVLPSFLFKMSSFIKDHTSFDDIVGEETRITFTKIEYRCGSEDYYVHFMSYDDFNAMWVGVLNDATPSILPTDVVNCDEAGLAVVETLLRNMTPELSKRLEAWWDAAERTRIQEDQRQQKIREETAKQGTERRERELLARLRSKYPD